MRNILILSSIFAIINSSTAWGSLSNKDGKEWGEMQKPFKTSSDPDVIVRDIETREKQSPPHIPLLRLEPKKTLLSPRFYGGKPEILRLRKGDKAQSYREGEYGEALRENKSPGKSFAERIREEKTKKERELRDTKPNPKDLLFQELFLDPRKDHGLNLGNINKRRELVRGDKGTGGGVSGGGEDFSSYVIILQGFFGTIAREEDEIKKLEEALAVSKTEEVELLRRDVESDIAKEEQALIAHQAKKTLLSRSMNALKLLGARENPSKGELAGLKSAKASLEETEREIVEAEKGMAALESYLQAIRTPEDIQLEITRTTKRLKFFMEEEERTIEKLELITGISLKKLRKLPPIAPARRKPANKFWD